MNDSFVKNVSADNSEGGEMDGIVRVLESANSMITIEDHLLYVRTLLLSERDSAGNGQRGRALSVAITDLEKLAAWVKVACGVGE